MFPDIPDKLLWALAVVATLAVMATRGYAGLAPTGGFSPHLQQQAYTSTGILHGRY